MIVLKLTGALAQKEGAVPKTVFKMSKSKDI
jgi:hypothetical protein